MDFEILWRRPQRARTSPIGDKANFALASLGEIRRYKFRRQHCPSFPFLPTAERAVRPGSIYSTVFFSEESVRTVLFSGLGLQFVRLEASYPVIKGSIGLRIFSMTTLA